MRMRERLREELADVGLDPSNFGIHNFRSGRATAAANAIVPDRLMVAGGTKMPRTDIAKTILAVD